MISSKPCYVPTTTSNDQQSCFWNGNDRDDARPGTETTSTSIHSLTHNISLMMAMYLLLRRFAGKNNHSCAFSSFNKNNKKNPKRNTRNTPKKEEEKQRRREENARRRRNPQKKTRKKHIHTRRREPTNDSLSRQTKKKKEETPQ